MQLIIRADANTSIGTGHLMRCLALSQAWQDEGGTVLFVTNCESNILLQRIKNEGFEIYEVNNSHPDSLDWEETSKILNNYPGARVILDGYHFDPAYQKNIKELGHRLLVIDDMAHLEHYYADIILNQNIGAEELNYSAEPYTKLLLGPEYVLLRREFWKWQGWQREIPEVAKKILVTMGGGDPDNVTLKVLQALEIINIDGLEIVTVVGAANPHLDEINELASNSRQKVTIKHAAENMPELMAWADLAITAGGSTCWELAFMGLPFIVIVTADNQVGIIKGYQDFVKPEYTYDQGLLNAIDLSKSIQSLSKSKLNRKKYDRTGRSIIDGFGTKIVISNLKNSCYLKKATLEDSKLLWRWVNEKEVRKQSFKTSFIDYKTHYEWLKNTVSNPNSYIYIYYKSNDKPIGQIRIDIDNNRSQALIDVSIAKNMRGKGYGSKLIDSGIKEISRLHKIEAFIARIKDSNTASVKAFTKAGFFQDKIIDYGNNINTIQLIRRVD